MKHTLEEIESFVVQGNVTEAKRRLRELTEKKVPREALLTTANLARRAGLQPLAIRLLNPVVHPKGKAQSQASDGEKAEYAALLTFIGAAEESLELLKSIDPLKTPQVNLFYAFALFSQWDYEGAIGPLKDYLFSKSLSSYQKLVGRLNLIAALVDEKHDSEAEQMLEAFLKDAKGQYQRLYVNALELSAQHFILKRDFSNAQDYIELARSQGLSPDSTEAFILKKWEVICGFLKSKGGKKWLNELHHLKSDANKKWDWETIRDCDRFEAIQFHDKNLFAKVYFGSPYKRLRQRLIADFGGEGTVPAEYLWSLHGNTKSQVFDLLNGEWKPNGRHLKIGQSLHRLFIALASDFYRPLRVAVAHHRLNPNEFYHPISSPPRVYEAIRHLREWLKKSRVPIDIDTNHGFYQLIAQGPVSILIREQMALGSKAKTHAEVLKGEWGQKPFSVSQTADLLGISIRSALRLLEKMQTEDPTLKRQGKGPATRYLFSSNQ